MAADKEDYGAVFVPDGVSRMHWFSWFRRISPPHYLHCISTVHWWSLAVDGAEEKQPKQLLTKVVGVHN